MDSLFSDLPVHLSPRLLWMLRHNITTENHEPDEDGNKWTAFRHFEIEGKPYHEEQSRTTEDDALTALAVAAGIRLWFETQD